MNRVSIAAALLLASGLCHAGASATFGNRLVTSGDSTGKVFQVAGKPDRVVDLQNRFGASTGERWEYYQSNKTVQITIKDGRVTDIEEVYN